MHGDFTADGSKLELSNIYSATQPLGCTDLLLEHLSDRSMQAVAGLQRTFQNKRRGTCEHGVPAGCMGFLCGQGEARAGRRCRTGLLSRPTQSSGNPPATGLPTSGLLWVWKGPVSAPGLSRDSELPQAFKGGGC